MDKEILTYRDMRQILSREELHDMVAYNILVPIEKINYAQSWKFRRKDVNKNLYKKLIAKRNQIQAHRFDELLANKIENEWAKTSKRIRRSEEKQNIG